MLWLFIIACVLWAGVAIGAAVYGYSRGRLKGRAETSTAWTGVWNAYDTACADFCTTLLNERNQYKTIAEAYAERAVAGPAINVKGVGKA